MGVLKKLAGETAIYGMSTILARVINFYFVPIYTRILSQESYGAYSEIMSYVAVLQVLFMLGLETGCFKFANREQLGGGEQSYNAPFKTALSIVTLLSGLFFVIISCCSGSLANIMGYEGQNKLVIYVGAILALDSISAILFARLRFLQKAFKFAIIKGVKILSEMGFNFLLFFWAPGYMAKYPDSFLSTLIPSEPHFSYIILAVLLSSILATILFIPTLIKLKFSINRELAAEMLWYSLPIMVAGLPGIINECFDRILFRFFAPESVAWRAELGVYQAAIKLAVIMNLFIQMFRYAAEPFFFAKGRSKELLAKVMEYFTAFCMLIFLGVVLYIDVIGLFLGKDFRGAIATVPFMLISYMLLGILFNVSMWYKLSGQTKYAISITSLGLLVTVVVNVLFMPYFSYWASVAAHILSCLAMLFYSLYLGNRYYPIDYNWAIIIKNSFLAIILFIVSLVLWEVLFTDVKLYVKLLVNSTIFAIYAAYLYSWGKKRLTTNK